MSLLSGCVTFGTSSNGPAPAPAAQPAVAELPPPPPPPPPLPDVKDLVGLTADDLLKYFGDPNVRRHEPPAEVWHYVGPECVLHLFLYDNAKAGEPVVSHVEISERGPLLVEAAERRDGVCIEAFLKPDMDLPKHAPAAAASQDDPTGDDTAVTGAAPADGATPAPGPGAPAVAP